MRTLIIGRSPAADLMIAEPSVAPYHAELVVTADGRYYLTDCGSVTGTWRQGRRQRDGAPGEAWRPVRQTFVGAQEPLRLGAHSCTVAGLLQAAKGATPPSALAQTALRRERRQDPPAPLTGDPP